MKIKCDGCGVKIQSNNPKEKGYIRSEVYLKNPDYFLCERCFMLTHYNRNIEIELNEDEFLENIEYIRKSLGLVVNIVDIFDLEGSFISDLKKHFPKNPILFVANKFDLYLKSTKISKIKSYLSNLLMEHNIIVQDILVISSFRSSDVDRLISSIRNHQNGKDVYFFGMTNVGKSSILNVINRKLHQQVPTITVSNMVSTTLGNIKIPLGNKTYIYDTPGIVNRDQLTYYLDKSTIDRITPKKYIKPVTFQLNPNQSLFIGGFCRIDSIEGSKSSFTVCVNNEIPLHRTKLASADTFYEMHRFDILEIPTADELTRLGSIQSVEFRIDEESKKEVSISGLGFVTIKGNARISVTSFQKIHIKFRPAIV